MKNLGFLLLAALFFFGAFRYTLRPDRMKAEFSDHPIGHSPILMVRALGVVMAVLGVLLVYALYRSL
ncbi:MAG: hypothetical protein WCA10_18210 [Terracidiphilus sp.]